jgi:hypothetical protein
MIDKDDGFDHHWEPCEEGCPSDLYCGKCSCGEYGCPLMDEGTEE